MHVHRKYNRSYGWDALQKPRAAEHIFFFGGGGGGVKYKKGYRRFLLSRNTNHKRYSVL
jgi:hypothetical protein